MKKLKDRKTLILIIACLIWIAVIIISRLIFKPI